MQPKMVLWWHHVAFLFLFWDIWGLYTQPHTNPEHKSCSLSTLLVPFLRSFLYLSDLECGSSISALCQQSHPLIEFGSLQVCLWSRSKALAACRKHFIKLPSELPSETLNLGHFLSPVVSFINCHFDSSWLYLLLTLPNSLAYSLHRCVCSNAPHQCVCTVFKRCGAAGQSKGSNIRGGKANHEHRGLGVTLGQLRPLKTRA